MKFHPKFSDFTGERHLNQHPLPKEEGFKIICSFLFQLDFLANTAKGSGHWWPGAAKLSHLHFSDPLNIEPVVLQT